MREDRGREEERELTGSFVSRFSAKEVLLEKAKGVEKGFFSTNENKTDNAYRQSE